MALLGPMPRIVIPLDELRKWGTKWLREEGFEKKVGMDFGEVFDKQVGAALAAMLGNLGIITPSGRSLLPADADAVEVGPVRVVGGIRPQNFDVGYRPDGVRFVFDSKTLSTVGKNFQNMVNDLGTEATTVHTRFPFAVVGFMVVIPSQCLVGQMRDRFTGMLGRLVGRSSPINQSHKAEAVSLVLWDPATGTIANDWPPAGSPLRIECFSEQVEAQYRARYAELPPHDRPSATQRAALRDAGEAVIEPPEDDTDNEEPGT